MSQETIVLLPQNQVATQDLEGLPFHTPVGSIALFPLIYHKASIYSLMKPLSQTATDTAFARLFASGNRGRTKLEAVHAIKKI